MHNNQFHSLNVIHECPVCKRKRFSADIKVIKEDPEAHLLHVRCKHCSGSLLVQVSFGEFGAHVLGILTDLNSQEASRFVEKGALTADEMIEIHSLINSNNFINKIMDPQHEQKKL